MPTVSLKDILKKQETKKKIADKKKQVKEAKQLKLSFLNTILEEVDDFESNKMIPDWMTAGAEEDDPESLPVLIDLDMDVGMDRKADIEKAIQDAIRLVIPSEDLSFNPDDLVSTLMDKFFGAEDEDTDEMASDEVDLEKDIEVDDESMDDMPPEEDAGDDLDNDNPFK